MGSKAGGVPYPPHLRQMLLSTFISMIRGHVGERSWTRGESEKGYVTSDLFSFGTQSRSGDTDRKLS